MGYGRVQTLSDANSHIITYLLLSSNEKFLHTLKNARSYLPHFMSHELYDIMRMMI